MALYLLWIDPSYPSHSLSYPESVNVTLSPLLASLKSCALKCVIRDLDKILIVAVAIRCCYSRCYSLMQLLPLVLKAAAAASTRG